MEDLALKVRDLDAVVVDDGEVSDPRRPEVLEHRGSEAAGADDEDPRGPRPPLAEISDLWEAEMPRVPGELIGRERVDGLDERAQRCPAHGPITRFSVVTLPS